MASTVLIITGPSDIHADAVIRELHQRAIPVFRLHPEDFPRYVTLSFDIFGDRIEGEIVTQYRRIMLSDICSVWYRRPNNSIVSTDVAPESVDYIQEQSTQAIRTLYAVLNTLWVSNPFALRLAEVKAVQLMRANQVGLVTSRTLISNDPEKVKFFLERLNTRRCAIKSLRVVGAATKEGWRLPLTTILPKDYDLDSISLAPTIFQPYIEKSAELRCVVIDKTIFPVKINSQLDASTATDWRAGWISGNNKGMGDQNRYEIFSLPKSIETSIHRLMQIFDIKFASLDMIITPEGDFVFVELNPNGQWLWLEMELGIPLVKTMADLLTQNYIKPHSLE